MVHRLARIPRGLIMAVMVMFSTFVVMSVLSPGARLAIAQEGQPAPQFSVTMNRELAEGGDVDGDGVVDPGDTLRYTLVATNSGSESSGPVEIVARLDTGLIATVTNISGGGVQETGGDVVWSVEDVAPGATATVTFDATLKGRFPSGRSQLIGLGLVRSPDGVELGKGTPLPLEVVGPILKLIEVRSEVVTDANNSGRLDAGDTVRVTIAYNNTGAGPSEDATIVSDYPEELVAKIVDNPNQALDDGSSLTWAVGSVGAGGEPGRVQYDVQLQSQFPAGVTKLPVATEILSGGVVRDASSLEIDVSGASLTVESDVSFTLDQNANQLGNTGDEIQFQIGFANVGDEPATSVTVTADYNERFLEALAASDGGRIDAEAGTVTWTVPEIGAGQRATLTFGVRILSLPEGLPVINTSIKAESPDAPVAEAQRAIQLDVAAAAPAVQPTSGFVTEESLPQGSGILSSFTVSLLLGGFLFLSLLSLGFVASRVLSGPPPDTDDERAAQSRLVREIVEGVVLALILFAVMMLGLQNALDADSVNSIIAGIVGYVAGRVASQR